MYTVPFPHHQEEKVDNLAREDPLRCSGETTMEKKMTRFLTDNHGRNKSKLTDR